MKPYARMKGVVLWPARYERWARCLSFVQSPLQCGGNPTNLVSYGWQFPPELEEFALGLVHHSVLRLDDLIDYIHDAVKPRAIATQGRDNDLQPEKLKHPAPRPVIRCWLFEVS